MSNTMISSNHKVRKANNIKELESIMTVTAMYMLDYYSKRPVLRFLARARQTLGIQSSKLALEFSHRARSELSFFDYNYEAWYQQVGKNLSK